MTLPSNSDELLDLAILRTLDANDTQFGFTPEALVGLLPAAGHRVDVDRVNKRLRYLSDKALGMVERVQRGAFHPANAPWRITATGQNHLREQGF